MITGLNHHEFIVVLCSNLSQLVCCYTTPLAPACYVLSPRYTKLDDGCGVYHRTKVNRVLMDGTAALITPIIIRFIQGLYLLPWMFTVVEDVGHPGTSRAVNGEHSVLRYVDLFYWSGL